MKDAEKERQAWQAMESLHAAGKVRALGLSNYDIEGIERILSFAKVRPVYLQIKYDLYYPGYKKFNVGQRDLVSWARSQGITVVSYSTMSGYPYIMRPGDDPHVKAVAMNYGKTPAQVVLRHALQRGLAVLPCSVNTQRVKENFELLDFQISAEDMLRLDALTHFFSTAEDNSPGWIPDIYGARGSVGDARLFTTGARVQVKGLTSAEGQRLNGQFAKILSKEASGRWNVEFEAQELQKALKPDNLAIVDSLPQVSEDSTQEDSKITKKASDFIESVRHQFGGKFHTVMSEVLEIYVSELKANPSDANNKELEKLSGMIQKLSISPVTLASNGARERYSTWSMPSMILIGFFMLIGCSFSWICFRIFNPTLQNEERLLAT
eukprot:gnl/MRDRNA2_/MRDRNA2_26858_c0_seq1.p1 gnl/MRDRNA2_/MRDRNA2_26858_c0~~gnl/MRDRNA2_/MRDRNA2_26858_c0_seq1.p1  ORF type:complete len:407 (+),score=65.37 gnl/MRDRNA2_/MRDRNA2_26858_c0_seq1:84-1223(+)